MPVIEPGSVNKIMCCYALKNEPIEGKIQMTHGRERIWQGQNWQFT